MKQFTYVIEDQNGIHARPAGLLAKKASEYNSKITLIMDNKRADTRRIMMLMALGIKCGDQVEVVVEGDDEELAMAEIKKFLEENRY